MNKKFSLDELNHFTGSDEIFQHWISKMCYTEGVRYLADKTYAYWLVDAIAFVILPRLLKENKDSFYSLEFSVNSDQSAMISVSDGNSNIYLNYPIKWTDFPIEEKPVNFYLCDSGDYYCLMLPSEY
jgi:glutamine cyclotransferase